MVLSKLHPGSVIWRLCLPRRFRTFFGTDRHYSESEGELRVDLLDERAALRNYVRSVIRSGADEAYASIQANVHRHRSARAGNGARAVAARTPSFLEWKILLAPHLGTVRERLPHQAEFEVP